MFSLKPGKAIRWRIDEAFFFFWTLAGCWVMQRRIDENQFSPHDGRIELSQSQWFVLRYILHNDERSQFWSWIAHTCPAYLAIRPLNVGFGHQHICLSSQQFGEKRLLWHCRIKQRFHCWAYGHIGTQWLLPPNLGKSMHGLCQLVNSYISNDDKIQKKKNTIMTNASTNKKN